MLRSPSIAAKPARPSHISHLFLGLFLLLLKVFGIKSALLPEGLLGYSAQTMLNKDKMHVAQEA